MRVRCVHVTLRLHMQIYIKNIHSLKPYFIFLRVLMGPSLASPRTSRRSIFGGLEQVPHARLNIGYHRL